MHRPASFALALTLIVIAVGHRTALGTPTINNLLTVNCDNQLNLVVTGDSIVRGVGDTRNGNRGGYVARLREIFPDARITNAGYSGIRTDELLRKITRAFAQQQPLARKFKNADHIIIDVGRNDFQTHGNPSLAARNVKRLNKLLRARTDALITVATMLPTTRSNQQPFVLALNSRLLQQRSSRFAVELRFDRVAASLIDSGGIHPTSEGFDDMGERAFDYLLMRGNERAQTRADADADVDGLSDYCEQNVVGTDPETPDSDGDGLSDGDEVYDFESDPLTPNPE